MLCTLHNFVRTFMYFKRFISAISWTIIFMNPLYFSKTSTLGQEILELSIRIIILFIQLCHSKAPGKLSSFQYLLIAALVLS